MYIVQYQPNTNKKFRSTRCTLIIYISELSQEKKISLVIPFLFSPHAFGWSSWDILEIAKIQTEAYAIVLGDRCVDIRKQGLIQLKRLIDEEKSCWPSESNQADPLMVLTQMSSLALNSLATIMHYGNRTSGESPLIKALIKGDITTRLKYIQRQKTIGISRESFI